MGGNYQVVLFDYKVVRFPPRRPLVNDPVRALTRELHQATENGWEYVGLLSLATDASGYSGFVGFRRAKK